ncbi:hypothetical protein ACFY4C_23120 [Actinomadura viridis]
MAGIGAVFLLAPAGGVHAAETTALPAANNKVGDNRTSSIRFGCGVEV